MDPHTEVLRELLVRYLDAWTPAVLRAHRGATYVETGGDVAAALRVFGEFADRLDGQRLDVVLLGAVEDPAAPEGLTLRSVADPADLTVTGPALAHLTEGGTLDEQAVWQVVATLLPGTAREVFLTLPPTSPDRVTAYRTRLRDAGLSSTATVELADDAGHARLLVFATSSAKHLTTFKNELWSADEFAGIRYRDPRDTEHALVDISLTPQLLPLRRALLGELSRRGRCTVADLQEHTLQETIYRPTDTVGVLTSAASAGVITREPAKGRLSPRTVVTSAG